MGSPTMLQVSGPTCLPPLTAVKSCNSLCSYASAMSRPAVVALIGLAFSLAGCLIPVPVPLPAGGDLREREDDLNELLADAACRDAVIRRLGRPNREFGADMSYLACHKPAGHGLLIIPLPVIEDRRGADECFELVLHFDDSDRLVRIEKRIFAGRLTVPDTALQWDVDDPRQGDAKPRLCKAADAGDARAQYRLAVLYENGTGDLPRDPVMAYVWYRLAESNDTSGKAGRQAVRIIDDLDAGETMRAEKLIRDWKPGFCGKTVLQTLGTKQGLER